MIAGLRLSRLEGWPRRRLWHCHRCGAVVSQVDCAVHADWHAEQASEQRP